MPCPCGGDPKAIYGMCYRIAFGGALLLVGVIHYIQIGDFSAFVAQDLGALSALGTLWAYILPALQIAGGALIIWGQKCDIASWCVGVALASIAIGVLLKPIFGDVALGDIMPAAQNALTWFAIGAIGMMLCCKGKSGKSCGSGSCDTGAPAPSAPPSPPQNPGM